MMSSLIASKISSNQIVLYRRVSTSAQEAGNYQSQLRSIKNKFPKFSVARSTITDIKEVMSGLADPEVRFCAGLGKALGMLIRLPHAIILVSNLDRLGRSNDVFDLIQAQGLGQRIMDAETGRCLDDLMAANQHQKIVEKTDDQKRARKSGQERYQASGGIIGSLDIKQHSRQGTKKKKALARTRLDEVLKVVTIMVRQGRGRRPRMAEIADELNRRGIRTGQGRLFDAERLSQLRKSHRGAFRAAFDSYRRDRQRLRAHVMTTNITFNKRGRSQHRMQKLAPRPRVWTSSTSVGHRPISDVAEPVFERRRRFDRCRSPPCSFAWSRAATDSA